MERISQFRVRAFTAIFALVLCFFAYKLYDLQIVKTGGKVNNVTAYTTWTRVKAARGDILDRNGNVLVGNRASYDLVINHYVMRSSPTPNQSIYDLVTLCKDLDIEYTDRFPVTQSRPFTYTLDDYNSAWQGYFQTFLQNRGQLDSDISAPMLIQQLRKSYEIPEAWTDEEARLVIGIRYELSLRDLTNLSNYVFIADASDEDLSAIMELSTPGMNVESSTVREYHTEYAAHILGYVGAMSKEQWEYYKTIKDEEGEQIYAMDAEVGQSGFEQAFEQYLHGTDGIRVDTVTPDGTVIDSYYKIEPKAGNNVETTIDIALQRAAEEQLEATILELQNNPNEKAAGKDAEGGSLVAMDVKTGQVLACASYPTYDLANFFENYNEIVADERDPLYNRALNAAYPPGSTYKMCMVIAAMNAGTLNMEKTIETKGVYDKYIDTDFAPTCLYYTSTWHLDTHGTINASMALCVSCNYFFYVLGDKLAISYIDETAKSLGLGEPTGIELYENIGHRANPETKAEVYKGDRTQSGWYNADTILTAIGQSENRFSTMQLCSYVNTLANAGTRYRATFLSRIVSTDYRNLVLENRPEVLGKAEICNDAYLSYMQGMRMVASYNESTRYHGTAVSIFGDYPIEVCAKTGTAQTGIPNTSDHGQFVCFAPYNDPQISVAVFGEKAGSGSVMGHVAKAVLDVYFAVDSVGDVPVYENQMS